MQERVGKKTGSFETRTCDYSFAAMDDFTAQKAKVKLAIRHYLPRYRLVCHKKRKTGQVNCRGLDKTSNI